MEAVGGEALLAAVGDPAPGQIVGAQLDGDHVARAYAVRLTAPTLDAATNEAAIDVLELKAAGITVIHH